MPINNPTLEALLRGISSTESGNNYNAIGPRTKSGHRAYGFSQVLDTNIAPWTKQFYGQELTPEQYLNTPVAQDKVTQGKLGELLQKHGTPQDAASVWFSGRPLDRSVNASDGFIKTPEYIQRVMQAGGMPGSFNDARSFQATGTDDMANAASQPPGAQSISLGDQENQQPFNNIGSTLANMGASIASLDNRGTGIASLNASRVAGNLAAQENAREAQGGWKYAGQTQNGQGLMFQNSRGEIRVEPLAPGFAGEKESSTTKFLKEIQANPKLADTYKSIHSGDDVTLSQEAITNAANRIIGGEKSVLTRMSKGNAARILEEVSTLTKGNTGQILENQIASTGKSAEARTIGTSVGKSAVSAGTFASGVTNALEASKKVGRGEFVPFNKAEQLYKQNTSDPDFADFKAAHETMIREYAKAINPNGNPTVSDMNHARELLSTATDEPAYERVVARLQSEVANKQKNLEKLNTTKPDTSSSSSSQKRLKYNPQTGELE
jgi:hypothetical protein